MNFKANGGVRVFERVLVLAPHTDDGEIGCGGTITKLIEQGSNIFYVAFSTCEQSVPEGFPKDILAKEVRQATKILGIKDENLIMFNYEVRRFEASRQEILEDMVNIKNTIKPDLVLMPSLNDIHQDHSTIAEEGLRAFKRTCILGYEMIWNSIKHDAQCFISLDENHIMKKIEAIKQYKSQSKIRNYINADFIISLARVRGVQAGIEFAEVFDVLRWYL